MKTKPAVVAIITLLLATGTFLWNPVAAMVEKSAGKNLSPAITLEKTYVQNPPLMVDLNGDGIPDYVFAPAHHGRLTNYNTTGAIVSVIGACSSKDFSHVLAISGKDGSRLWEYKAGGETLYVSEDKERNRLLLGGRDGAVHSISITDGKSVWDTLAPSGNIVDMVVDKEMVFALNSRNQLYCINESDGKIVWHKPIKASIMVNEKWRFIRLCNGVLVVASIDNKLKGLDPASGEQRWSTTLTCNSNLIAQDDKRVYVFGSRYFTAYDVSSGKKVWSIKADIWDKRFLAFSGGKLFLLHMNRHECTLSCVTPETGEVIWQKSDSLRFKGSILVAGLNICDNKVVTSGWKSVACHDVSNGKLLWSSTVGKYIDPLLQSGNIVLAYNKHLVEAFDVNSGKKIWSHEYPHKKLWKGAMNTTGTRCCIVVWSHDQMNLVIDMKTGKVVETDTCYKPALPVWADNGDLIISGRTSYIFKVDAIETLMKNR